MPATAAAIIADVDRGRAPCHDRHATAHQPAYTDPYVLPLGDAFIAELRARYGERCIDDVSTTLYHSRSPRGRPSTPTSSRTTPFPTRYDDEYALDLGGYQ